MAGDEGKRGLRKHPLFPRSGDGDKCQNPLCCGFWCPGGTGKADDVLKKPGFVLESIQAFSPRVKLQGIKRRQLDGAQRVIRQVFNVK